MPLVFFALRKGLKKILSHDEISMTCRRLILILLSFLLFPFFQASGDTTPESNLSLEKNKAQPTAPAHFTDPTTGMEFVWVPGGCFRMGDTFGDGRGDEKPVHEVCVDGFWMGKTEVTQSQWQGIMGNNPSNFNKGDSYPVEEVSWNDVQNFIRKLNSSNNRTFRLPTEAEWEFAARSGGQQEKYAGTSSESDLGDYTWYRNNSRGLFMTNGTRPVGQKRPNGGGLYDMNGNVWEWCSDWYDYDYYQRSPRNNPQGPPSGETHVGRGGSWSYNAIYQRLSLRGRFDPDYLNYDLGFRLVSSGP